jgi:uncharacterized circularly permuted ATP-grasp superfamily protein
MHAAAVQTYNRLVERDPASAVEQEQWLRDEFTRAGITFAGAPMRSFLRPQLLGRAEWERLRRASARLLELAARVARAAFAGDAHRLCDFLGLPPAQAEWVCLDPGPPDVVLSRLDAFLTPGGGPRFLEINSDAPAGFGYGDRMTEVFARLPVFRAFARDHAVTAVPSTPALIDAVLASWRESGGSGTPAVAIVDWSEVKTRADQELLRESFAARDVPCVLADPREFQLLSGRLHAQGRTIDVVYRRALLGELVERQAEVRDLLTAYRDRRVLFVNSLRCALSEDKAFLGLLTGDDFETLLDADERAFVAEVLPWTRRVSEGFTMRAGARIDLVPHVVGRRQELVLKPAHGYGGQSVLIGAETEPAVWERAVRSALDAPWVAQERVPPSEELFPVFEDGRLSFELLKLNSNPFYAAGRHAGAVARASRSAVVNVSAGGGSVPMFLVDDDNLTGASFWGGAYAEFC